MSTPNKITFNFLSDGLIHNASISEVSDSILICESYNWLLIPKSNGLDAAPTYSFEVSDDNINWQEFQDETKDALITQPFQKSDLPGLYFRINYDAVANTSGTVSFDITLKQN